jgi:L-ribulose-5-phosphate 3-epimerase
VEDDEMPDNVVGCTTVAYLKHPLQRALEGIRAAGLTKIELAAVPNYCEHVNPRDRSASTIEQLQQLLSDYGVTPVSLSGHTDLTSDDGLDYLEECVQFAVLLGLQVVNTGSGPTATEENRRRFIQNARTLGRAAEEAGIKIGLETQDDTLTSGESAVEALAEIGSPAVGLNLDPANISYWGGLRPEDQIDALAPHVVHMHVKDKAGGRGDYYFPPLGQGEIDFGILLKSLQAAGFDGPFILEPELSQSDRPPAEVEEARQSPGTAYSNLHSYLGENDPAVIDAEIQASRATLDSLLASAKSENGQRVSGGEAR